MSLTIGIWAATVSLLAATRFDVLAAVTGATHSARGSLAVITGSAPDTLVVFGPKQFVTAKSNNQVNFVESFSVPIWSQLVDTSGTPVWQLNPNQYTVRMRRVGGSLTTATVVLNNVTIATVADFASATYIERSVSLFAFDFNTQNLTVTLKGAAAAGLVVTVVGTPSSTFDVFGPKVYTKTATTPTHFVENFSLPADASVPYLISARASVSGTKATVTLNGVQVIKATDFGTSVTFVSRTATLVTGSNSMQVDVTGSTGTTITVEVTATDKTPPILSITSPLPSLVSNATNLAVTGTSQDRSATQVTVNGVVATMGGVGNTQFSATIPLIEGSNAIAIRATDLSGNHSDSTRTVTRDTHAPVLTLTSPVDGSLSNQTTATVSGTVTDGGTVTLKVNGVSVTVGTGGAFTTTIQLAQGANFITAVATDQAGNNATVVNKVTLDTQPPALTVTAPAAGLITKQTNIVVSGTATDASATTVTVNGVNAPVGTGGSFSLSVALAAEGSNAITVVAKDAALNQTTVSRSVVRDTQAPVLTVTSPVNATFSNAAVATVSGTATDASAVTVSVNGTAVTVGANGAFSYSYTLVPGPNLITVTATDAATNVTSAQRTVTQDLTPPTLTLASPANASFSNATVATVVGTVTDANAVTVSVNGTPVAISGNGSFFSSYTLAPGPNVITVTATDAATNTTIVQRTVTQDQTPPVLTLTSPANAVSNATVATVSGTATDASALTVNVNGTPVTVGANGAFSYSYTLAAGANLITVTATDAATNATIVQRTVTQDLTPPTLTLTSPTSGAYSNAATITVTGTASDAGTVTVSVNGNAVALNADGSFSYSLPLTPGANAISVVATDGATNATTVSRNVIQDLDPPVILTMAIPIIDSSHSSLTNADTAVVTITAQDASPVTVRVNGVSLVADANGKYIVSIPLVEGWNYVAAGITDAAGNDGIGYNVGILRDTQPPVIDITSPLDGAHFDTEPVTVSGSIHDSNSIKNTFTVMVNGVSVTPTCSDVADCTFETQVHLAAGSNPITAVVREGAGNTATVTRTVTFGGTVGGVPPDPATIAPTLDATIATTTLTATSFLYSGATPIQTGVAPGTIQRLQAAELRGKVKSATGAALPAATVTVVGHPEFGQTLSRADGSFDLAVNGGDLLTVNYQKTGYLPAQRQVVPAWQSYTHVDSVTLVSIDPISTVVDFSQPAQAAQASPVTDGSGTRRATMIFKGGTQASLRMADGTTQSVASLTVRATEFTVGAAGPSAMPGALPSTSAYTYAVELSADEAIAAGAAEVQFDRPVAVYVDNFLSFPTGGVVPVGYYDRAMGVWIGSQDGRVIKVLQIANGQAVLDIDGSGSAATPVALAALGIDDAELAKLAELYQAGKTLWRIQVTHFTPWDCNWPVTLPPGAKAPKTNNPTNKKPSNKDCHSHGSIIGCERQTLGERLAVAGTSLGLNYQSDGVPGYKEAYSIDISLGADSLPPGVQRIDLEVRIAGQVTLQSFPAQPNQSFHFVWDGKDLFGRNIQGVQQAHIRIGYAYTPIYANPKPAGSAGSSFGGWGDTPISADRARNELEMWEERDVSLGSLGTSSATIGGWSLDVHHYFDPASRTLYLGNGTKRSGGELAPVATTVAGGTCVFDATGNCGPIPVPGARAVDAYFSSYGMVVGGDGSMYLSDEGQYKIWRVNPAGTLEVVAGNGTSVYNGDGIAATSAGIFPGGPRLLIGPDNSIYFVDYGRPAPTIRRVDKNGIIANVIGSGNCSADSVRTGIPAVQANICVEDFALSKDGTIYVVDGSTNVFRIGADGILTRILGSGSNASSSQCPPTAPSWTCAEGMPATAPRVFTSLSGIAVGPDGSLYLHNSESRVFASSIVYRIGPDGIIRRIAGNGLTNFTGGFAGLGNGKLATDVPLPNRDGRPVIGPDGTLYMNDFDKYLRHVDQNGVLRIIAGCVPVPAPAKCTNVGGERATLTRLSSPSAVAFGPDGALYIADDLVRRIDKPMPTLGVDNIVVASENGSQLYVFNADGRHLRTLDALLGQTVYEFGYDGGGLLSTITDVDGNVVRVERDGSGTPTAIVAPFGQRTTLTLNSANYIASVTRPGEPTTPLTYSSDGLLQTFTDGNGNLHRFTYDANGLLTRDDDAAGGFKTLTRTVTDSSSSVTVTTALGKSTTQSTTRLATGATRRTSIDGAGLATTALSEANGTVTLTGPDGTITTVSTGADPRLGMQALMSQTATAVTPGGVQSTMSRSRTVQLQDPHDVLSLVSQIDSTIVNGHVYTSTFTKSDRSVVVRSPGGRTSTVYFDARGHLVRSESSGLAAIIYSYDPQGRLTVASRGGRAVRYTYDALGRVSKIAAPLGDSVKYTYDAAGRLTQAAYADGRQATYAYDNNGNLTSIVPPERGGNTFTFTPADLNDAYLPPSIGGDSGVVRYSYDVDHRLGAVNHSDGTASTYGYDTGGRLASVLMSDGTRSIGYDAVGNVSTLTNSSNASVMSFGYDGVLALTSSSSGPVQGSVSIAYDNESRIGSVSVNGSDAVAQSYDADGLVTTVGALSLTRSVQTGFPTVATIGGVSRTWVVDSLANISRTDATFSGSQLYSAVYTPDSLDRISTQVETVQGTSKTLSYSYNNVGRLTEVRDGGALVASYDYDATGNRIRETTPSGTITSVYDAQDRMVSHGTATYAYTANGEVRLRVSGSDTTKYQYDPTGTLSRVVLGNGTVIEYVLDPAGRRVGRKVNGLLVQGFLYSGALAPVAELDGQNIVVSRFVYGISRTVPSYMVKNGVTYALITDHVGSVRLVVNSATGAVAQRMDYDSWGRVTQNTNPGFQPFGFAGGLYDDATGLVRFGARNYDAESGRWTTKDPIGFAGGANMYRYVGDDPVNFSDPNGLDGGGGWLKAAAFSAGVGDALTLGLTSWLRKALDIDDVVDRCSSWYSAGEVTGVALGLALGEAITAQNAARETVSLFHGSINDATAIARDGFDAARTPTSTWVTRDIEAAQDAIGPGRVGPMSDPGIIESRVPKSEFNRLLESSERPYDGFNSATPGSSEIVLRTPQQIDLFNQYRVRLP